LKQRQKENFASKNAKLPDKNLFSNHAPSKVDQRKLALEKYLQHVISLKWDDDHDLREFLKSNVIEQYTAENQPGYKEGYLTKRGKSFGKWKTRYFVIKKPFLEYYESKDGHHLGSIRLANAQIGRQQNKNLADPEAPGSENAYRHAFLIMEQKGGLKGPVKHILCAESDAERDEWVETLLQHVGVEEETQERKKDKSSKEAKKKLSVVKLNAQMMEFTMQQAQTEIHNERAPYQHHGTSESVASNFSFASITHDQTSPLSTSPHTASPLSTSPNTHVLSSNNLPSNSISQNENHSHLGVSAGQPLRDRSRNHTPENRDSQENSNLQAYQSYTQILREPNLNINAGSFRKSLDDPDKRDRKGVRMTFFGKSMFGYGSKEEKKKSILASSGVPKIVFGVPLDQAIAVARIKEGYELPAIVYRCIGYLDAKNAAYEEGIYRLSGSSNTIKMLKERFNTEGDIDLLAEANQYDVHAISGLLKLYLRELPTPVLTRDLHPEFVNVVDLLDRGERINELGRLVSALPIPNYTLLRTLIAHLIHVVQNSDINKMTARNIGIVFSPTLGIPAGVFNLFIAESDYIFFTNSDGLAAPRTIEQDPADIESDRPEASHRPVDESANSINEPISPTPLRYKDLRDELGGRSNRNSVHYMDNVPEALVGLEKKITEKAIATVVGDDEVNDLDLLTEEDDDIYQDSGDEASAPQLLAQFPTPPVQDTRSAPQSPLTSFQHPLLPRSNSVPVSSQAGPSHMPPQQTPLPSDEFVASQDDILGELGMGKKRRLTVRNYTSQDSMFEIYEQHRQVAAEEFVTLAEFGKNNVVAGGQ